MGEIVELEVLAQASPLPSCVCLGKSYNLSGTYPLLISHRGDRYCLDLEPTDLFEDTLRIK